ncbi:hypothetical protein ACFQ6V_26245 [Streptomyces roseifaciens]
MSGRNIRGRLARLVDQLPDACTGPVCRYHGVVCQLGRNWPVDRPADPFDEVRDLIRQVRIERGSPVDPDPRELWAVDEHEQLPEAVLLQEEREVVVLIAGLQARNDQVEAQLRAGGEGEPG